MKRYDQRATIEVLRKCMLILGSQKAVNELLFAGQSSNNIAQVMRGELILGIPRAMMACHLAKLPIEMETKVFEEQAKLKGISPEELMHHFRLVAHQKIHEAKLRKEEEESLTKSAEDEKRGQGEIIAKALAKIWTPKAKP